MRSFEEYLIAYKGAGKTAGVGDVMKGLYTKGSGLFKAGGGKVVQDAKDAFAKGKGWARIGADQTLGRVVRTAKAHPYWTLAAGAAATEGTRRYLKHKREKKAFEAETEAIAKQNRDRMFKGAGVGLGLAGLLYMALRRR